MARISFESDFAHHPLHYFTLLCILLVGLWGLFWFDYNPAIQLGIVISLGVAYVVWGIVHHLYHRDLHLKIILEYVLMATLAVLIFGSLLFRA